MSVRDARSIAETSANTQEQTRVPGVIGQAGELRDLREVFQASESRSTAGDQAPGSPLGNSAGGTRPMTAVCGDGRNGARATDYCPSLSLSLSLEPSARRRSRSARARAVAAAVSAAKRTVSNNMTRSKSGRTVHIAVVMA